MPHQRRRNGGSTSKTSKNGIRKKWQQQPTRQQPTRRKRANMSAAGARDRAIDKLIVNLVGRNAVKADDKANEKKDKKRAGSTFGGGRVFGDSTKLAKARYALYFDKHPNGPLSFDEWKRGRQAQHLIPASVARDVGLSETLTDSARNGMMLPPYPGANIGKSPVLSTKDVTKPYHLQGATYRDHPTYSNSVRGFMKIAIKRGGKNNATYKMVMDSLRHAHKNVRKGVELVDDISVDDMRRSAKHLFGKNWDK